MRIEKLLKEGWTVFPLAIFVLAGWVVSILDFVHVHQQVFQPLGLVVGLGLFVLGGYIEARVRVDLKKKAGFGSLILTKRLQIVDGHQLITDVQLQPDPLAGQGGKL